MLYQLSGHRPQLEDPDHTFIADTARVIGRVSLARDVSVWYGAVIRGDEEPITIGRGSNIQDGSVLHTDHGFPMNIGRGVTVGHMVMLHGAVVGDGALIGIGSIVLNGAVIGAESLIGAGSLITEGKVIPEGVLVMGRPGKIVRDLTLEERASLARNAEVYASLIAVYRTLSPL